MTVLRSIEVIKSAVCKPSCFFIRTEEQSKEFFGFDQEIQSKFCISNSFLTRNNRQECHVQPLSASKQVHLVILYLSASFSQRFPNPVLRASVTTATSILWDFSILLKILVPPAPPFLTQKFSSLSSKCHQSHPWDFFNPVQNVSVTRATPVHSEII